MKLELVSPHVRYRDTFLRALPEFRAEGLSWWLEGDIQIAERDFAAFVSKKLAEALAPTGEMPAKTHRWAVIEGDFVGRIAIFHGLNEALRLAGGHIGYDTVPSLRGRGVATEMLRQALPIARGLGLSEVLLTCDDTNTASIRVIEKNGGSLRDVRPVGDKAKRYYCIRLL